MDGEHVKSQKVSNFFCFSKDEILFRMIENNYIMIDGSNISTYVQVEFCLGYVLKHWDAYL